MPSYLGLLRKIFLIVFILLIAEQPFYFKTRFVEAGFFFKASWGRTGRGTKFPPQFGQLLLKTVSAHEAQNVHSKEQITASGDSGGKSLSQRSQFGRSSSIDCPSLSQPEKGSITGKAMLSGFVSPAWWNPGAV